MSACICTYSVTQFEITDDTEAVQMLQRSTQVGEFYVMGPPV
jgi:hypothetical protein